MFLCSLWSLYDNAAFEEAWVPGGGGGILCAVIPIVVHWNMSCTREKNKKKNKESRKTTKEVVPRNTP